MTENNRLVKNLKWS